MEDVCLEGAERDVLIQQAIDLSLSGNILHDKVADLCGFPFAVKGDEACEQLPLCLLYIHA
jgi:hypothetical protein